MLICFAGDADFVVVVAVEPLELVDVHVAHALVEEEPLVAEADVDDARHVAQEQVERIEHVVLARMVEVATLALVCRVGVAERVHRDEAEDEKRLVLEQIAALQLAQLVQIVLGGATPRRRSTHDHLVGVQASRVVVVGPCRVLFVEDERGAQTEAVGERRERTPLGALDRIARDVTVVRDDELHVCLDSTRRRRFGRFGSVALLAACDQVLEVDAHGPCPHSQRTRHLFSVICVYIDL